MAKILFSKSARFIPLLFFLNFINLPAYASSALAAWSFSSEGVLELRTKPNSKLKAFFQKANNSFGDRFWIDFEGELKTPRTIKGNGPVKEIRLGKPSKGKTRLVIEFNENNNLKPLKWKLIGKDANNWKIKIASFPRNSFETLSEGVVGKLKVNKIRSKKIIETNKIKSNFSNLPSVKKNKFYVVIDPGHGGPDSGAIGIDGLRETDVVLDVSKTVSALLKGKGVNVKMTRVNEVDLDLSPRVSLANRTGADIFVSIHANASRGKKKYINGLETFYYDGWKGRLLAQKIQKQILKVSPGSPDRGVRRGRYYVIKKTNMPAVLVEIGFVTGRLDARRLEKSSHRKRVAYAIAKGILEYLRRVG
tara:strand:+ start:17926 stop:19014 length:1089 start_codon:yes stop_codon:yes gene_type:complete